MIIKTIKESFDRLQSEFTKRAICVLCFGVILLGINIYLFTTSLIYAFSHFHILEMVQGLVFGILGFAVSCFLIFYLSLYYAATPQKERKIDGKLTTISSNIKELPKEKRKGAIAIYVFALLFIWGMAFGSIGYYIWDVNRVNNYISTTAIVTTYRGDSAIGMTVEYRYTVDGQEYTSEVITEFDLQAVPKVGDRVTVRYHRSHPEQLYSESDSTFFFGFGTFFLWAGVLIILAELMRRKKISWYFFLAYVMLGFTGSIFVITAAVSKTAGMLAFISSNLWVHFVAMFTNVGFIMLFEGFVELFFSNKNKKKHSAKILKTEESQSSEQSKSAAFGEKESD